jgi:hypothetical protein
VASMACKDSLGLLLLLLLLLLPLQASLHHRMLRLPHFAQATV